MATLPHEQRRPQSANRGTASTSGARAGNRLTGSLIVNSDIIGRRYWARRIIDKARGAAIPTYGSPEWASLPEGDARRVASVVLAAEAWAQAGDTLEDDLRREVEAARLAYKEAEDADYQARAARHRQSALRVNVLPFAARRQAQLDAGALRDGDHRGGPVEWSGDSA